MITTSVLVDKLINDAGIEEFCGVSDSTLKYLINELTNRGIYTPFTNEGDAVSYAAGRTVAGHPTAVLMQNSGLTNAASPISSLTSLYDIPLLYIVGWRGYQEEGNEFNDEPQHRIVGKNTFEIATNLSSTWKFIDLPDWTDDECLTITRPDCQSFLMIHPGQLSPVSLTSPRENGFTLPRLACISALLTNVKRDPKISILSTTGYTSRELMSFGEDSPQNFYMLGSMGCLVPFTYGVAKSHPDRKFIMLDGDGSYLMRPQASLVCNDMNVNNVMHIIFRNRTHLSTGNQDIPATNHMMDMVFATNHKGRVYHITDLLSFTQVLQEWLRDPRQEKVTMLVDVSSEVVPDLPRPKRTPEELLRTFQEGLGVIKSDSIDI